VEPAQLVELPVVRRIRLGRDRQRPPPEERDGAVEEEIVHDERHADGDDHVPASRGFRDAPEGGARAGEQRLLEEEVAAGVRREPELGTERVMRAGCMDLLQEAEVRLGVERRIGDAHLRNADGYTSVAVSPDVEEVVAHRRHYTVRGGRSPRPPVTGRFERVDRSAPPAARRWLDAASPSRT
jgi:hypothetical protein